MTDAAPAEASAAQQPADPAVEALRAARQRPAVAKLELAKQRSASPNLPILAFEGDDDKIVYFQWISRIRPGMRYVSFPCSGKGQLLSLRKSLLEDETGLSEAVYFFADRDFDDLRGQDAADDIYMTDMYSVENYIVSDIVLDTALQIEFHCHADKGIRDRVISVFKEAYGRFLDATFDINKNLYIARKFGIEIDPLPSKIGKIIKVTITMEAAKATETAEIIKFRKEIPSDGLDDLIAEFETLDPKCRYRGKFAFSFFKRWLEELSLQNDEPDRGLFVGLTNRSAFRVNELSLNGLASKSDLPAGLVEFVAAIDPPVA